MQLLISPLRVKITMGHTYNQHKRTKVEEKEKEGGRESYGLSHKTKKEDIENFRLYDWILKKETGGVHTQLVDIQV